MVDYNKRLEDEADDEGSGGRRGDLDFHDFLGTGPLREDLLPPDQLKRIIAEHRAQHETRVKKQKELRDNYKAVKEGKQSVNALREQRGSGLNSSYPPHPVLADKAQFSGIDKENNPNPADNIADTNEADRNELENQYRLQHQPAPKNQPKFNPKPQMP